MWHICRMVRKKNRRHPRLILRTAIFVIKHWLCILFCCSSKNRYKKNHISPILAALYWLPVHFRIHFKIILYGLSPPYLTELLHPYSPTCSLTVGRLLLSVPKSKNRLRGDRAFAVPRSWNDLPLHIRHASSLSNLKSLVKTHFFGLAFNNLLVVAFVTLASSLF